MVVIKEESASLERKLGKEYFDKLGAYADVIGFSIEEDGGETKLEFNPDRPDLFSFYSLKESMKCFYDKDFWIAREPVYNEIFFEVTDSVLKKRPFALSFVAKGKRIGNMLDHLIEYQERLHSTIGKDRKKVSIGIHDLTNISPPFVFDALKASETRFTTYDGLVAGSAQEILSSHPKGIEFSPLIPDTSTVPIISDKDGEVLSMPPIINGIKSKITENTSNFFVDITGTDPNTVRNAFHLLSYEMLHLGYRISFPRVSDNILPEMKNAIKYDGRKIKLDDKETEKILGFRTKDEEILLQLRKMGYMAEISASGYDVYVPGNRIDVMGPVDLIEDIAKGIGFSAFREKELSLPMAGIPDRMNESLQIMKDVLIGIGIQEVKSFVVTSASRYANTKYEGNIELLNPKSLDFSVVRDRLFLNLLDFLRINQRRPLPQKIFEIGSIVENGQQMEKLCVMLHDSKASYSSARQILDYFMLRMGGIKFTISEERTDGIIPGRGGKVIANNGIVGIIGEVDPSLIVSSNLRNPASFFEIYLEKLNLQALSD